MEKHIDTTWGSELLNGKENHESYDVISDEESRNGRENQSYNFCFGISASD